jgi:ribosomal protein S18 acetylase RimI-like enzyme
VSEVRVDWLPGAAGAAEIPAEIAAVHRVVSAVMERGGAVGWVGVPDPAETAQWLTGIAAEVAAGRTRMALVRVAGRVEALGRWTRYAKPTVARNGEILQVMVHPAARGQGLARRLVGVLVEDARAGAVETLTLDVRGNNHAAMALYESFGFEVYGRLPDFVAVGADRWDRVLYRLDLRTGASPVRRHGGRPVGAGASTVRSPKRRGQAIGGRPPARLD